MLAVAELAQTVGLNRQGGVTYTNFCWKFWKFRGQHNVLYQNSDFKTKRGQTPGV